MSESARNEIIIFSVWLLLCNTSFTRFNCCCSRCLFIFLAIMPFYKKKKLSIVLLMDNSMQSNYTQCCYWTTLAHISWCLCAWSSIGYTSRCMILALPTCAASTMVKSTKLFSHTSSFCELLIMYISTDIWRSSDF